MSNTSSFEQIAKLIKPLRLKQGLSQTELSHSLGYKNGQFISNVERALCSIPGRKIAQLAVILKVDESEIIKASMADTQQTLENCCDQHWKDEANKAAGRHVAILSGGGGLASKGKRSCINCIFGKVDHNEKHCLCNECLTKANKIPTLTEVAKETPHFSQYL